MPTASNQRLLCRYHYDPLNRQIGCSYPGLVPLQRFYCKSRMCTEIRGAQQISFFQIAEQPLSVMSQENGKTDVSLLTTDRQFSILSTMQAAGLQALAYSPYGFRSGNGLFSLLGFNGERPDPITGHYPLGNGYRSFNSVLMRFNSPDKWSPFGRGGINAYAYCAGDPVNRRDPNGRWFETYIAMLNNKIFNSATRFRGKHLSTRSVGLLEKSVTDLGGEQHITRIANENNIQPADYFFKESKFFKPLTYENLNVTPLSPRRHMNKTIDMLDERYNALTEIGVAYTNIPDNDERAIRWTTFRHLRENIDELKTKVKSLRDTRSAAAALPSHAPVRETVPRAQHYDDDPPPSYEEATKPR